MWELSQEERMIRDAVRQIGRDFPRSYWLEKARQGAFPQELWDELARAGFTGLMVPEAYGGAGMGLVEANTLVEALAEEGIPLLVLVVCNVMDVILIARYGTEEQKRRFLPEIASGRLKMCFAITEPGAGSNTFRTRTLARRDGDFYVINGQKTFITGVDVCEYILLVTRTAPYEEVEDKREGFSLFLVPTDSPGLTLQPVDIDMPLPEKQFTLFLDEVRVPRDLLLGEAEGKAFRWLFDALNPERVTVAGTAVGLGRYCLEKAVAYANRREVFHQPIGSHQGLQHPLAIAKIQVEQAALMARYAAWLFDRGRSREAAGYSNMAKFAATEAAIEACNVAIEVHGGLGFTGDVGLISLWPLVRALRTIPVSREMILNYVGEHILGLPRSYGPR